MSLLSKKTLAKKLLQSKRFREAYVFEHIKRHIPFQIRTMRTERDWSQAKAGEAIGKPQNVISRLESPAYNKLTLQTLLDVARGFDVGLVIKFVPFSRLVQEYEDVSFDALSAPSVSGDDEASREERQKIEEWAAGATYNTAEVNALPTWAFSNAIRGQIIEFNSFAIKLPINDPFSIWQGAYPAVPLYQTSGLVRYELPEVEAAPEIGTSDELFFKKKLGTPIPEIPIQEFSTYL